MSQRTPFRDRSPLHYLVWRAVVGIDRTAYTTTKALIDAGVVKVPGPEERDRYV
jgi:hypothetical protein